MWGWGSAPYPRVSTEGACEAGEAPHTPDVDLGGSPTPMAGFGARLWGWGSAPYPRGSTEGA